MGESERFSLIWSWVTWRDQYGCDPGYPILWLSVSKGAVSIEFDMIVNLLGLICIEVRAPTGDDCLYDIKEVLRPNKSMPETIRNLLW